MGCLQRAFSTSQEEFRDCVGYTDSIHPPTQCARIHFQGEEKRTRGEEFRGGAATERT